MKSATVACSYKSVFASLDFTSLERAFDINFETRIYKDAGILLDEKRKARQSVG